MKPLPAGTNSESIFPDWQGVGDLLDQAVFVADSCVYLDLYRLVGTAREDLVVALRSVMSRLWVPHEVMKQVLDNSRTMSATILREAQECAKYVGARVDQVDVATRRQIVRTNPLDTTCRMRLRSFIKAGRALEESLLAGGRTGAEPAKELGQERTKVSEIISALTADRVGPEPTSAQLQRWVEDSRQRLNNRMPPTYSDRKHKKPRRHGDCIIWHEMLEFAISQRDMNVLVLVTRDTKAIGWVEYESQKLLGAHRDLVREMAAAANTRFIVMGTDDLLAYTKDAAIKVVWTRDTGWGDTEEVGTLRPVSSFFP